MPKHYSNGSSGPRAQRYSGAQAFTSRKRGSAAISQDQDQVLVVAKERITIKRNQTPTVGPYWPTNTPKDKRSLIYRLFMPFFSFSGTQEYTGEFKVSGWDAGTDYGAGFSTTSYLTLDDVSTLGKHLDILRACYQPVAGVDDTNTGGDFTGYSSDGHQLQASAEGAKQYGKLHYKRNLHRVSLKNTSNHTTTIWVKEWVCKRDCLEANNVPNLFDKEVDAKAPLTREVTAVGAVNLWTCTNAYVPKVTDYARKPGAPKSPIFLYWSLKGTRKVVLPGGASIILVYKTSTAPLDNTLIQELQLASLTYMKGRSTILSFTLEPQFVTGNGDYITPGSTRVIYNLQHQLTVFQPWTISSQQLFMNKAPVTDTIWPRIAENVQNRVNPDTSTALGYDSDGL